MMLLNRISEQSAEKYNQLISRYILDVFSCKSSDHEMKSKQVPFYIACLLGKQAQCELYSSLLLQVTNETHMKQYHAQNYQVFTEGMCTLLLHSVQSNGSRDQSAAEDMQFLHENV
jgi:hypothetical protein